MEKDWSSSTLSEGNQLLIYHIYRYVHKLKFALCVYQTGSGSFLGTMVTTVQADE